MKKCCFGVWITMAALAVNWSLAAGKGSEFVGFYTNETTRLALYAVGGSYTGVASNAGQLLPVTAKAMESGLSGTYTVRDTAVKFSATRDRAGLLTLVPADGSRYVLRPTPKDWTRVDPVPYLNPVGDLGQSSGAIDVPGWGVRLHLPETMVAVPLVRDFEIEVVAVSPGVSNAIFWVLRLPHKSHQQVIDGFTSGLTRQGLTFNLKKHGKTSEGLITGHFDGTVGNRAVEAFAVVRLGDGCAVAVVGIASKGDFTDKLKTMVMRCSGGVRFVESSPNASKWRRKLMAKRLINIPQTTDPKEANAPYRDYYAELRLDLGSNGYFAYRDGVRDLLEGWVEVGDKCKLPQVDAKGFWLPLTAARGAGTWDVVMEREFCFLVLQFYTGERYRYELREHGGHVKLNGKLFSVTGPDAPVDALRPFGP